MTITWQDNVTPLDATNMNKLEQTARKAAANGYPSLDAGSKVPVAQIPVLTTGLIPDLSATYQAVSQKGAANGYVGLDASTNIALAAASKIVWAGDTNVYRSGAGVLNSDGTFLSKQNVLGNTA